MSVERPIKMQSCWVLHIFGPNWAASAQIWTSLPGLFPRRFSSDSKCDSEGAKQSRLESIFEKSTKNVTPEAPKSHFSVTGVQPAREQTQEPPLLRRRPPQILTHCLYYYQPLTVNSTPSIVITAMLSMSTRRLNRTMNPVSVPHT